MKHKKNGKRYNDDFRKMVVELSVGAQSCLNGNRTVSRAKAEVARGAQGAARAPNG